MKSRYLFVLLVISTVLVAVPCNAQVVGKNLKIFVGYSNLQAEGLQNNNTPPNLFNSDFFRDRTTLHGVDGSITGAYKGVGLTGDVSFNRHSLDQDISGGGHGSDDLDIWYFLAGPAFHYAGNRRLEPFVRIMAGAAYTRRNVAVSFPNGASTVTSSFQTNATSFAMGAGGGLDVRLGAGPVRLRLFQIDYTPIFFRNRDINVLSNAGAVIPASLEGDRADNVRVAVGIVF